MGDLFHRTVVAFGRGVFLCATSPTVLHAERTRRDGAWLIAINHGSDMDIMPVMRSCHRRIDWLSITEVFAKPFIGWLAGKMGAFPIDRSMRDTVGVRRIYERLEAGRVVGMFPEGRIPRRPEESVLHGAALKAGIGQIAHSTGAPILPCVLLDAKNLEGVLPWLPLRRARYGIIYGEPLRADPDLERKQAARLLEEELAGKMRELHRELLEHYTPTHP